MNFGKIPEGVIPNQLLEEMSLTRLENMNNFKLKELSLQESAFGNSDDFAKEFYRCRISGVGSKDCETELDVKTGNLSFFNNMIENKKKN